MKTRLLVLIAGLLASLVVCSPAAANIGCSYAERPPAGSPGNFLFVDADEIEDQAAVVRQGMSIRVTDDQTGAEVSCSGGVPTVENLDTIQFRAAADGAGIFVSLAGGPFAPGASRVGDSPEIQIRVRAAHFPGNVGIGGSRRADRFRIGHGSLINWVNFDPGADTHPDFLFPDSIVGALFRGGAGSDVINGRKLRSPAGLSLSVYAGPGRDRIFGGAATDFLSGRAGGDFIAGGRGADEVDCGQGRDAAVRQGRDRFTGCERIRPTPIPRLIGL